MIDTGVCFRSWLLTSSALLALVPAEHIVMGTLPEGANPGNGETWLTFHSRGGDAHKEMPTVTPHFVVTAWADRDQILAARAIYRAVFDLVHQASSIDLQEDGFVMAALEQVQGQDVTDPATEWQMCVAYFEVMMRAQLPPGTTLAVDEGQLLPRPGFMSTELLVAPNFFANWLWDVGVKWQSDGTSLMRSATRPPPQGQYYVIGYDGIHSAIYSFNLADTGKTVLLTYRYST